MQLELHTVQNVKDLQESGKRWLEGVLGQDLRENQQVFIMVFTPGVEPDEASRGQARAGLERTFQKTAEYAETHCVADGEIDAAVDEAMQQVRPGPDA
jgi:hypothetical protein